MGRLIDNAIEGFWGIHTMEGGRGINLFASLVKFVWTPMSVLTRFVKNSNHLNY